MLRSAGSPGPETPAGSARGKAALPAGSRRPRRVLEPSEAEFQKSVTDLADTLGIWWYHPWQPKFDHAGFPDLTLVGGRKTIFRELKKTGEDPTREQLEVGERLRRSGEDWDVWRPADMRSFRIRDELQAIR